MSLTSIGLAIATLSGAAAAEDPPCRVTEVALEADFEFAQAHFGGDAAAAEEYLQALVLSISSIFERDVGLRLEPVHTVAWDSPADPYTRTDPQQALNEFRAYWLSANGDVGSDVQILLSGKNLDGAVTQIQFFDTICEDRSFGLLSAMNGEFPRPLMSETAGNEDPLRVSRMVARFIHAQSLRLIDDGLDPCSTGCGPTGTIFSSCDGCAGGTANTRLEFHPVNVERMLGFTDGASCLATCACPADLNEDGTVDTRDFLVFLAWWSAQDERADWNLDGAIDTLDFLGYLDAWAAGDCP